MEAKELKEIVAESKTGLGGERQFLTFRLKTDDFGVEILQVKEILEFGGLTRVPMVPEYVRGVMNLRGNVVPVLDLNYLFNKSPAEITRRSCVVIVDVQTGEDRADTGILVDSVDEVVELSDSQIEMAPSFGTKVRTEFILGMGKLSDERIIMLLNMETLLSYEELDQLSGINFGALVSGVTGSEVKQS